MDPIKYWLICFAKFYQLDLVLKMNFVSDNIISIFSQSNVNITIDTKIHQLLLCIFQIKQNRLTVVMERIIKRI